MGNILRVFKRDLLRLLKAPAALVVVVALAILPSVYTWYNVLGFWDPYENTGNLRVCVVNLDHGGSSELTGKLDVGERIVGELRQNRQLDWDFTSLDEATEALQTGKAYAAFIIPEDFTAQLLTLTAGEFRQPQIEYLVNEKAGPVAPKITDAGASVLDETINSTFVSTVSDAVVQAIDEALGQSKADATALRSEAVQKITAARDSIMAACDGLAEVQASCVSARMEAGRIQEGLQQAQAQADEAAATLADISALAQSLQTQLGDLMAEATPSVSAALTDLGAASARANAAIGALSADLAAAGGSIDAALGQAQTTLAQSQQLAEYLQSVVDSMPDTDPNKAGLASAVEALKTRNQDMEQVVSALATLNGSLDQAISSANSASNAFDAAVQEAVSSGQDLWETISATLLPQALEALNQVSVTTSSLSSAVLGTKVVASQAGIIFDSLSDSLGHAEEAITQTEALLSGVVGELDDLHVDVSALDGSAGLASLLGIDGLDAQSIAAFMGSPTEVVTEELYPLNAYGSAMAPLFMNLTFWIGAFMLMVIMRQEVDGTGVEGLTITQAYLGRFLLFASIVIAQAVICCAGVLLIGVQAVSPVALFVAAILASLAYLSIIYALSVTLQHIGKGICIVLVFAQIPGATGLYPIEMTSGFFQAIYPFFPFTYGIGAMREAICGFYGAHYATDVAVLLLFFTLFMALGIGVRPYLANVNRMVANQIRKAGLFNGEKVEVPARPYRTAQILRVLADKEEYREIITHRYERLTRLYPKLIRGALIFGIGVPIIISIIFAFTPAENVWVLTFWLVWLVAITVFLVVVESLRYSIARQMRLDSMSTQSLFDLFNARKGDGRLPEKGARDA